MSTILDRPSGIQPVYWLDVDRCWHNGHGSLVIGANDAGTGNNSIKAVSGKEPIYQEARWNKNLPSIDFNNQMLSTVGVSNPVVQLYNSGRDFTVFTVYQPRHSNGSYIWSFSLSTAASFTKWFTNYWGTDTYVPAIEENPTSGSGTQYITAATERWHPVCYIQVFRKRGAQYSWRDDGINGVPVNSPNPGAVSIDSFSVGGTQSTSPTATSMMGLTDCLVFDGYLDDAACSVWERHLAFKRGLEWKAGLGATDGPTLVIAMWGQSNMVSNTQCGDALTYPMNNPKAFMLGMDGLYRQLVEPSHDPINRVDPFNLYVNTGYGASMAAAVANRLQARGETRKLLFVPCAANSTTSDNWAANITSPPTFQNLGLFGKHRIAAALKAHAPRLLFLVDQGEANADSAPHAAQWQTDWNTILNALIAYFGADIFDKQKARFIFGRESLTINGTGGFDANVRAAEDALLASRTDMKLPQRGDSSGCSGALLHQRLADFRDVYGPLMADTYLDTPY